VLKIVSSCFKHQTGFFHETWFYIVDSTKYIYIYKSIHGNMISLETNEIEEKDGAEILVVVTTYKTE
jgi:hypothetical protein